MRRVGALWRAATGREKVMMALCVAYVLWPADLVPEALFGPLGLTDDLAALGVLLAMARRIGQRLR